MGRAGVAARLREEGRVPVLMRIVLPHLATNLPRAVVSAWHVVPGGRVSFGTPLCDITVTDRVKLASGSARANVLLRKAQLRASRSSPAELESDRFQVTYRVVASEEATITEIRSEEGTSVAVGDVLAFASVGGDGDDCGPGLEPPEMRVVASIVTEGGAG